jgi:hypothetical protein
MPARPGPRLIVLRWLAERFESGRRYPEREVNDLLRRSHPDYAMLRRYLVDHGLLERDHGIYQRSAFSDQPSAPTPKRGEGS